MTADLARAPAVDLFTPVSLGPYTLRNRMVMAPLTRNRAAGGGVPQDINVLYYGQRATAGLIVTEATHISPQGVSLPHTPGIYTNEQIAGWKRVTRAVHARGGCIFLQLWHGGRISHPSLQPGGELPVAPSAVRPAGETMTPHGWKPFATPRELATAEIAGIVEQFRVAALGALAAGFDGVEIHAANGYLLDQFLRDGTNRRSDEYGGSLERRARLLLDVTAAVSGVWGSDRVGVRLSPVGRFNDMSDSHPQLTFEYAFLRLGALRVAYVHVVEMDGDGRNFDFRRLRNSADCLYIANTGYTKERANHALAERRADLVSFGTLFLANPDLPRRFVLDAPLNQPDRATFYGGDTRGYTDYASLDSWEGDRQRGDLAGGADSG
ncbi:MAG TPA: alkene reductase [Usitatibacter sp.]|nr:alkene reductase [Usitatibacter sp.]